MPPDDILSCLREHYAGLLAVGERMDPVRFVLDESGRVILAAAKDALEEEYLTLHVPDDSDEAVHLLGRVSPLDPARDAACDRYRVYFGEPRQHGWLALTPDSIKCGGDLFDGPEVALSNPFAAREPGACRELNAHPGRLIALVLRLNLGEPIRDPRIVGVDPRGIDIRGAWGVLRVEFLRPIDDPSLAADAVTALIRERRADE